MSPVRPRAALYAASVSQCSRWVSVAFASHTSRSPWQARGAHQHPSTSRRSSPRASPTPPAGRRAPEWPAATPRTYAPPHGARAKQQLAAANSPSDRKAEPITFRGVACAAGCPIDFLYNNIDLRHRIEHLRAQQQNTPPPNRASADPAQPSESGIVRTLTVQLSDLRRRHRTETLQLKAALATARARYWRSSVVPMT